MTMTIIGAARSIIEQTGTDCGDAAAFLAPMMASPRIDRRWLGAPCPKLPSRKCAKRVVPIEEQVSYHAFDTVTLMGAVLNGMLEQLGKYGFLGRLTHDPLMVVLESGSGRKFLFRIIDGIIAMSGDHAEVWHEKGVGIVCDDNLFMAWPIPGARNDVANGIQMSFDKLVAKIVVDCWWFIMSYDMILEVAPFVDQSIDEPIPDADLEILAEKFIIVPRSQFKNYFDHVGFYRMLFAPKSGIAETSHPRDVTIGKVDQYTLPVNVWKNKFTHFSYDEFMTPLSRVKWMGITPVRQGTEIYWDDKLRVRLSNNGIGIIECRAPNIQGDMKWCAVHAIPVFPASLIEAFANEASWFVKNFRPPVKYAHISFDFAKMLWDIYESNADEAQYNSGIAYYRDGQWGIDYQQSGQGNGACDSVHPYAPFMTYNWGVTSDGLLAAHAAQVFKINGSHVINPHDLRVFFHPSFPQSEIVKFLRRFTYSS
jgi:hypothetical protein